MVPKVFLSAAKTRISRGKQADLGLSTAPIPGKK